jgi:hypothetical protein
MILQKEMTTEEWNEMDSIRRAIRDMPSSVSPEKMERFTELFVRTLSNADDAHPNDRSI